MPYPPVPLAVLHKYFQRVKLTYVGDCWLWPVKQLNRSGYGQLSLRLVRYGKRRRFLAHRTSYRIHCGPISLGLQVMHSCDIKRCVNPVHLSLGTQRVNEADKVAKGRSSRGERRWSATLTDKQAQQLLDRYRTGEHPRLLAEEYCVTLGVAHSICRRTRWKHLK
jgi:hypothetical protein